MVKNYQDKDCKFQFIGDHTLSYQSCYSSITTKILHLIIRGSGIRVIIEVERISIVKILSTLNQCEYTLHAKSADYGCLEVDDFFNQPEERHERTKFFLDKISMMI